MATTVIKTRVAVNLGSISAVNTPVTFGLGDMTFNYRGFLTIMGGSGGAVTTPTYILEASLDQGVSWFAIPANTTQPAVVTGTFLTGDTAALFVNQYNVSGLSGALFHFGLTAGSAITAIPIWALVG
jgi:hypothetical protein